MIATLVRFLIASNYAISAVDLKAQHSVLEKKPSVDWLDHVYIARIVVQVCGLVMQYS